MHHSYSTEKSNAAAESPCQGRVCELSTKTNGLQADEVVTEYNASTKLIRFDVVPRNVNGLFPVRKNSVQVTLHTQGAEQTLLRWHSEPEVKTHGYLLYPLLKLGFSKGFDKILQDLKYFIEQGKPHPDNKKV